MLGHMLYGLSITEPEAEEVIRKDIAKRFGVQFPIFDKIDVNGATTHPLYAVRAAVRSPWVVSCFA